MKKKQRIKIGMKLNVRGREPWCLSVHLGTTYLVFFIENVLKYTCTLKKFEKNKKIREKVRF